jgi:hypothetical protein
LAASNAPPAVSLAFSAAFFRASAVSFAFSPALSADSTALFVPSVALSMIESAASFVFSFASCADFFMSSPPALTTITSRLVFVEEALAQLAETLFVPSAAFLH